MLCNTIYGRILKIPICHHHLELKNLKENYIMGGMGEGDKSLHPIKVIMEEFWRRFYNGGRELCKYGDIKNVVKCLVF